MGLLISEDELDRIGYHRRYPRIVELRDWGLGTGESRKPDGVHGQSPANDDQVGMRLATFGRGNEGWVVTGLIDVIGCDAMRCDAMRCDATNLARR